MGRKHKYSEPTEINFDEVRAYLRSDKAGHQDSNLPQSVEILRDSDDEFHKEILRQAILDVDVGIVERIEPAHAEAPVREKEEPGKKPDWFGRTVKALIYWPDEVKPEELESLLRHMQKRVYRKFMNVVSSFPDFYAQGKISFDVHEIAQDILSSMSMEHGFFRRFKKDRPEPYSIRDEYCYQKFSQRLDLQIDDRYEKFTNKLIAGISDPIPEFEIDDGIDAGDLSADVGLAEQKLLEQSRQQKQELRRFGYQIDTDISSEKEDLCNDDPEHKDRKRRKKK